MEPRQVFAQYQPVESSGLQLVRHCPGCGRPLSLPPETNRYVCHDCGYVLRSRTSVGVAIVVTDGTGRFVLCRRGAGSFGSGRWCLPQGGIEYGEDFLTAARREVREETNLDVTVTSLLSVTSNFLRPGSHSLVAVLLAEATAGELRAGDDADAAAWFSPSEPLPDMAFDADRHIIERYFAAPFAGAPVDPRYARG